MTNGQAKLYALILKKVKNNEAITYEEAKSLYIRFACREVKKGVPQFWNMWWRNDKDEMVGRWQPVSEHELNMRITQWIMTNIGSLVLKGYLQVLPTISFKEIKSCL